MDSPGSRECRCDHVGVHWSVHIGKNRAPGRSARDDSPRVLRCVRKGIPRVTLVRGRRFVDNGTMVSAGGLTSGIDAALHIVTRYYGTAIAKRTADYMEHYSHDCVSGNPLRAGTGT